MDSEQEITQQLSDIADSVQGFENRFNERIDQRLNRQLEKLHAPVLGDEDTTDTTDRGDFESFGELVSTIRFNPSDSRVRQLAEKRELSAGTGSAGGFAVPSGFVNQLFRVPAAASIFQPRITMLPNGGGAPDAPVSFPALDQAGSNGLNGGVTVSYVAEGGTKPATDTSLNLVTLEPLEIAARIVVTDKLLRNWKEATTILPGLLGQATATLIDSDIYSGTGAGKLTGYLDHSATISIARSVGSEVNYVDLAKMLARVVYGLGPVVWVVSHSTLPQFLTLTDGSGALLWLRDNAAMDVSKGHVFSFMGIPLLVLDSAATLGNKGDVCLVAPKAIVGRQGSGPLIESSPHVYFESNKSVIKITTNFDAKPWLNSPLTLQDGTTVSPFVCLE